MLKNQNKNNQENWWRESVLTFANVSGWIAFPVIAAVFIGQWLDNKYQTKPWLFLLSVGIAFAISLFGIVQQSLKYIKKIEKNNKKDLNKK